jgi:hypothetical protein
MVPVREPRAGLLSPEGGQGPVLGMQMIRGADSSLKVTGGNSKSGPLRESRGKIPFGQGEEGDCGPPRVVVLGAGGKPIGLTVPS